MARTPTRLDWGSEEPRSLEADTPLQTWVLLYNNSLRPCVTHRQHRELKSFQLGLVKWKCLIHYSEANLKIAVICRLGSEGGGGSFLLYTCHSNLFYLLCLSFFFSFFLSVCVRHSQPGVTLTCGRLALRSRILKRTSEMASSSCCCSRSSQVSVLTRPQVRNSNEILQQKKKRKAVNNKSHKGTVDTQNNHE